MRTKNSGLNATGKIIAILECVAGEGNNRRVKEISELLEMDRATVYRLVDQLAEQNMIKVDSDTKRITIGVKAFHIGFSFLQHGIVGEQIKYLLAKTAEKYPMAVGCAATDEYMIRRGQVYGLYELSTMTKIGFRYEEGRCYAVNSGVYGRVIMANHQPETEIEEILRSIHLEKVNDGSITDVNELLAEYEKIRSRGYDYYSGHSMEGLAGVGIPVKNGTGRVIACIGAAVSRDDWGEKGLGGVLDVLRECAGNVGNLFPGDARLI